MPSQSSSSNPAAPFYFIFRPLEDSDLPFVARWMTARTGLQGEQRKRIEKELLNHFRDPANPTLSSSWIAIAEGRRAFFLESIGGKFLYLTPSPLLISRPHLTLAAWRETLDFLAKITRPPAPPHSSPD